MQQLSLEVWIYIGYLNTAALAIVVLAYMFRDIPLDEVGVNRPGFIETGFIVFIIVLGLVLRLSFIEEFQAGKLTSDEAWMSIYYTSSIIGGEPVRTGATKIIFSYVFDLWHHVAPFTASWSRGLSALLGIVGVAAIYSFATATFGNRVGYWTAALSCISLYSVYFAKLSLEIVWALVIPPLVLLLVWNKWDRCGRLIMIIAGCLTAAGMFTYPGTILVFVALALGYGTAWFFQRVVMERLVGWHAIQRATFLNWIDFFFGFVTVLACGIYLHVRIYGVNGDALFFGGGNPALQLSQILSSLKSVLIDLFVEGRSWYLPYRGAPFVELFVWPLALLGIRVAWVSKPIWAVRGLVFAIPLIVILSAMTGAYPGMRRATGALPFLYLFASIGIAYILRSRGDSEVSVFQGQSGHRRYNPIIRFAAITTVVIGIGHSIYYQITFGRNFTAFNFGTGYVVEPFQPDELLDILQERDLIIDFPEGKEYFDKLFYKHYPNLARRYIRGYNADHQVHFFGDRNDPFIDHLLQKTNWILAGWDPRRIHQISQDYALCESLDSFGAYDSIPFVAYSLPLPEDSGSSNCQNPSEFETEINNSIILGYRYVDERVRHLLICEGPYCDTNRMDYIYTQGGAVSFSLRIPNISKGIPDHELKIHVLNGQPDRESLVYVDSEYIGLLNLDNVDGTGHARYRLEPEKHPEGSVVRVSIEPSDDPGKLGWDIDQVSIVNSGP